MPSRPPEPLSPELILVAPPEEAQRAREQLWEVEEPAGEVTESAPDWDEFLADVRSRPAPPLEQVGIDAKALARRRRRIGKRAVAAAIAIVVVTLVVGLAWLRDRSQQRPAAARVAGTAPTQPAPAPAHRVRAPAKKAAPAHKAPAHKAPAHRKAAAKKVAPHKPAAAKPKRTPKKIRPPARFVPARVFSWVPARGSRSYRVRFYRNGRKVLDVRTTAPRLALPKTFTFRPGRYRWVVVPISAAGKATRAIVDSKFVVGKG